MNKQQHIQFLKEVIAERQLSQPNDRTGITARLINELKSISK